MIDIRQLTVEGLRESLLSDQKDYATKFLPTSNFYDKKQFYDTVAEFISPKPHEKIVVDLGCGDGRLIRSIKKEYKKQGNHDITIIGVDVNPFLIKISSDLLKRCGYEVNEHAGFRFSSDPQTGKLGIISDLYFDEDSFKFERGKINLLQEDFRYGEVLQRGLEKDLQEKADVVTYTLPGGYSHTAMETEKYDSNLAGIEANNYAASLGYEILKEKGKMIWALRFGTFHPETLEEANKKDFEKYRNFYDVCRMKTIHIDERKERSLKLQLPGYYVEENAIYALKDVKEADADISMGIMLTELIKK